MQYAGVRELAFCNLRNGRIQIGCFTDKSIELFTVTSNVQGIMLK